MTTTKPLDSESLWDVQRGHLDEIIAASQVRAPDEILTHIQKQERYLAQSLQRCPRCGDHTPTLLPGMPLSVLCGPCRVWAQAQDGGLKWFAQILQDLRK